MVSTKNPNVVICTKCGNENTVYNDYKFILCKVCKSIKKIKESKIED